MAIFVFSKLVLNSKPRLSDSCLWMFAGLKWVCRVQAWGQSLSVLLASSVCAMITLSQSELTDNSRL